MSRLLFLLPVLIAALTLRSGAAPGDLSSAGVIEFRKAYQTWDAARLTAAAGLFRRAAAAAPANSANVYWLGVAEFHRLLHLEHSSGGSAKPEAVEAARDSAIEALTAAVTLNDADAESHALLGTLYGMKISGNPLRGAKFGPRVAKHLAKALQHGARNPRVLYLLGTGRFHRAGKPAEWSEALTTLQSAESLFAAEAKKKAGPLDPRWGLSSCRTFIGRTLEKLGRRDEAAAYFRQSLAIHPQDRMAQEGLKRVTAKNKGPA